MIPTVTVPPPALRFVEATHEYFYGGEKLPSVTQVLTLCGAIDHDWHTVEARDRGKWVHEACALLDRGELDETLSAERWPLYWPYVQAYQRFLEEAKPDICDVERRVVDAIYRYAGTLDRTAYLRGEWSLIDLKTGTPQRWHRLQTAAYGRLRPDAGRPPKRYGLYLRRDGTYRLEPFEDRSDDHAFLNAVSWAHWLRS